MKKISKNVAAANEIAADVATSILTNLGAAAPAAPAAPAVEKPAKAAKAKPVAKAKPKAKVATKTVEQVIADAAEVGMRVTVREVAVLKALATSEFADESGGVPSVALASSVEVEAKGNSPIPGLIASLNKKGLVTTARVKGQTVVSFTEVGQGFADALK